MSPYQVNPEFAARIAAAHRENDHKAEVRDAYELTRIRWKVSSQLKQDAAQIQAKNADTSHPTRLDDLAMVQSGALVELAGCDALPEFYEAEEHNQRNSESDAEGLRLRDSEFVFFCKNRAGEIVDAEAKEKADAAQKKIESQTINFALALASQGIPAFLPKKAPRASIVDPISEQRIDVPPVRRINYLPAVAKMRRAPMVKHLTAWVEKFPKTRMATFTIGKRRRLDRTGEIRAGISFMNRRISNLNAHPLLKTHGCHLTFRSDELGSLNRACPFPREKGTENGVIYAHIHAHVFLHFDHQLSPRRFKRFLRRMWSLWGYHWDYGRKIADPVEACKYPVKGADAEALTDAEHAALYRELRRMHMVQPLGELRETIAARHTSALKGRNWRDKDRNLTLKFRPDWNARPRMSQEERAAREAYRARMVKLGLHAFFQAAALLGAANSMLCKAAKVRRQISPALMTAICTQSRVLQSAAIAILRFNPRPWEERRMAGIRKVAAAEKEARTQGRINNRVCARLGPAPYFDRITRPALLVWNFDGDYSALRQHAFVREYAEAVRPLIERAEAALRADPTQHSVHTSHLTATRARGARLDPGGVLFDHAEAWTHQNPTEPTPSDAAIAAGMGKN